MSDNETTNTRLPCTVCGQTLCHKISLKRHMLRWHPTEWMNQDQGEGRQIQYYPCPIPGCNRLNNNTRHDFKTDHLSMAHGIDAPSRLRTSDFNYLKRKTEGVLMQHIVQEAAKLNYLNAKIRRLECLLNLSSSAIPYRSCHGLDVYTVFETDPYLLPAVKLDLVSYLQRLRITRNEVGWLYTVDGAKDIRDGIADELETLMGTLMGLP